MVNKNLGKKKPIFQNSSPEKTFKTLKKKMLEETQKFNWWNFFSNPIKWLKRKIKSVGFLAQKNTLKISIRRETAWFSWRLRKKNRKMEKLKSCAKKTPSDDKR